LALVGAGAWFMAWLELLMGLFSEVGLQEFISSTKLSGLDFAQSQYNAQSVIGSAE
jgi:hypothetical protein